MWTTWWVRGGGRGGGEGERRGKGEGEARWRRETSARRDGSAGRRSFRVAHPAPDVDVAGPRRARGEHREVRAARDGEDADGDAPRGSRPPRGRLEIRHHNLLLLRRQHHRRVLVERVVARRARDATSKRAAHPSARPREARGARCEARRPVITEDATRDDDDDDDDGNNDGEDLMTIAGPAVTYRTT
jgi:hypothetical protein